MSRDGTLIAVRDKVFEAIERTEHLIALTPEEEVRWTPMVETGSARPMNLGDLLGHLVDCVAGFCAVFSAAFPDELGNLSELRPLKQNRSCAPRGAREGIARMRAPIARGFALCREEDLARKIGTVFVAEGETIVTLLLGNFEHLTNHKCQLFLYLKLMGVRVGTEDLYRLRGN